MTILADPSVTTELMNPRGKAVQTVTAGSSASNGLFRTLSAAKPQVGTWHLVSTEPPGSAATQIDVAVQFTKAPLAVRVSVSRSRVGKGKHAKTKVTFTARVTDSGHAVTRTGTVEVALLAVGKRPQILHLRAVKRHAGEYTITTTKTLTVPAGVVVRAKAAATTTSAQLELQSGGCT